MPPSEGDLDGDLRFLKRGQDCNGTGAVEIGLNLLEGLLPLITLKPRVLLGLPSGDAGLYRRTEVGSLSSLQEALPGVVEADDLDVLANVLLGFEGSGGNQLDVAAGGECLVSDSHTEAGIGTRRKW